MNKYDFLKDNLMKNIITILTLIAIVAVLSVVVPGCKKKTEPVSVSSSGAEAKIVSAALEQKTCPVTGDPIDKNVFVEYQGKKVYFCCSDCKGEFEKNPEKYIGKLPQFAK
jgi:YHS domain-containing protein